MTVDSTFTQTGGADSTFSGNVGIGTSSPSSKLHVYNGEAIIATSTDGLKLSYSEFANSAGVKSIIGYDAGVDGYKIGTASATNLVVRQNGNVGIGTTSPSEKLHVVGNVQIDSGLIELYSLNSGTFIGDGNTGNIATATGDRNVAIGQQSFRSATDARYNTTVGHASMQDTTTGDYNSAFGNQALIKNISGNQNVAIGNQSLNFATASSSNTAVGYRALYKTQTNQNVAVGNSALVNLESSTNSGQNTAVGVSALGRITSGQRNIGIGFEAGRKYGGTSNENTTSNDSIFIGNNTDPAGDDQTNQIVIGYNAIGLGSNTVVLGNDSIVTTQLKGNVGIGTSSPSSKLHVYNGEAIIATSTDGLKLSYSVGNSSGIIDTAFSDNNLEFRTNGTTKMWIANAGNVGIGTTSPAETLDVNGNVQAARILSNTIRDTNNNAHLFTTVTNASNTETTIGNTATANTLTLGVKTSGTVTTQGNVGIGTTSPAAPLDVNGNIQITGGSNTLIFDNSTIKWQQYVNTNEFTLRYYNGSNWNERLRVDTDGNVRYRYY